MGPGQAGDAGGFGLGIEMDPGGCGMESVRRADQRGQQAGCLMDSQAVAYLGRR